MDQSTKQDQQAAHVAQLLREALNMVHSPAFLDQLKLIASERRARYLAFVDAGFTESQAMALCIAP